MSIENRPVLVIGATGFLGRRVVAALRGKDRAVRCMARTPVGAQDLLADGVTVVQGDMLDRAAVERAIDGVGAVIVCVQTLSPQGADEGNRGFMEVEAEGLRHIVEMCRKLDVGRVLYVTSIGVAEHANSSWLRGRWKTEQALFQSGLDVTVVRPGMIVGRGGMGFSIVAQGATKRFAMAISGRRQKFRTIAVDDLASDLVDLMDLPAAVGEAFEVGSDDVLTMPEMVRIAATSIGRRPGVMLFIPGGMIRLLAPMIERIGKIPAGAISGLIGDGPQADMSGNPAAVRQLLGRTDRPFLEAIDGQLR